MRRVLEPLPLPPVDDDSDDQDDGERLRERLTRPGSEQGLHDLQEDPRNTPVNKMIANAITVSAAVSINDPRPPPGSSPVTSVTIALSP